MFTGIVKALGRVIAMEVHAGGARLEIECPDALLDGIEIGDSIAVAGVCLTVQARQARRFFADVSHETLAHTNLGRRRPGDRINLEPALRVGQALGGHWVSGHVDGLARLQSTRPDGDSQRLCFQAPRALARYLAIKGSATLDGVSLTVNEVDRHRFVVNLVPHTLSATTLAELRENDEVNLEVDLIARYLERLLETRSDGHGV